MQEIRSHLKKGVFFSICSILQEFSLLKRGDNEILNVSVIFGKPDDFSELHSRRLVGSTDQAYSSGF